MGTPALTSFKENAEVFLDEPVTVIDLKTLAMEDFSNVPDFSFILFYS